MALSLAQAAKLSTDTLQAGVIETFARTSPVLEMLPQMEVAGNSYQYNQEDSLGEVEFRKVNEGYTEGGGSVVQKSDTLSIVGGDVDVDKFIARTLGNVNNQRAVQTNLKVKGLAKEFTNKFFHGDASANTGEFDGLKKRIANNGNEVQAGGKALELIMLHELLDGVEGGADALFMSKAMRRELQILLQESPHYIQNGTDEFGRPVDYFGDVQIRTVEDGILPFANGTNSNEGSIYAVRFGAQEAISGLTNGGVMVEDLGEIDSKPVYRTRIEFYCGLADFHPKAAARLGGVIRKQDTTA
ncbi:major capsid protein [Halobacillus ihumii]|uniref:major capsid protein n=1 Tax=Halobacillus ihumii TaxID=2686092 RepID=UPI0013D24218|nr:phage major capsid protein [Halobacillus ihumii]